MLKPEALRLISLAHQTYCEAGHEAHLRVNIIRFRAINRRHLLLFVGLSPVGSSNRKLRVPRTFCPCRRSPWYSEEKSRGLRSCNVPGICILTRMKACSRWLSVSATTRMMHYAHEHPERMQEMSVRSGLPRSAINCWHPLGVRREN